MEMAKKQWPNLQILTAWGDDIDIAFSERSSVAVIAFFSTE